jgi:hypothetical protein
MKRPDDKQTGLKPLTIGLAMAGSVGVWLVVEALKRVLS